MRAETTKTTTLDNIAEDLFSIPPLIGRSVRRKLLRAALVDMHEGILPPHLEIMKILEEAGTLHVAEISDKLQIPRPQMTHLIDRLAVMGIVERKTDPTDRRAYDITLTVGGKKILKKHDRMMRGAIKTTLSDLTEEDLEEMSVALRKLRDILSRL